MQKFLTRSALVAGLALATSSAAAEHAAVPSGTYVSDPNHTRLLWRIPHLGLSHYTARMNDVEIRLDFDAEDPSKSSVTAVIDPRSVDTAFTGDKDFDAEIYGEDAILNADEHPEIRFASTRVTLTDADSALVEGELTLLGATLPVTLEVDLTGTLEEHPFVKVPAMGFAAEAVFDRTEFGQDFLSGVALGDLVTIEVQTELVKM